MCPAEQGKTYAEERIKQIHRETRASILEVSWFLTLIVPEVISMLQFPSSDGMASITLINSPFCRSAFKWVLSLRTQNMLKTKIVPFPTSQLKVIVP